MALTRVAVELLARLAEAGHIPNRAAVIELGAQELAPNFFAATEAVAQLGAILGASSRLPLAAPSTDAAPIPAREFWTWLGCSYAAIDIDGSPGTIPLDLNYDDVPAETVGKHQLVTNFGTTEHVANQVNAFKVIHDLAAPGGVMVHDVPTQGSVNHGLVNYTPKFFWMLARSNGYEWLYLNYLSLRTPYAMPQNVVDSVLPYEPDIAAREKDVRIADMKLLVVLKKAFDIPFVAPLDVRTGMQTSDPALAERYWTVFTPDAFDRLGKPVK